jgi:hypothetical protein
MGSNLKLVRGALLTGLMLVTTGHQAVALTMPNQFCTGDPCVISSPKDVDPGTVLDFGTRNVVLQNVLNVLPLPTGAIGSVTIKAGSFSATGALAQLKAFSGSFPGGAVTIEVDNDIHLDGTITSGVARLSGQDAGTLTLITHVGSVFIGGLIAMTGNGTYNVGGTLTVNSAANIAISGDMHIDGGSQGSGGEFDLTAGGDVTVSGFIDLTSGGGGGDIDIFAGGSLNLGPVDMSGTGLDADAGLVEIDVGGNVNILDAFRGRGADQGEDCGDGSDVDISALGDITITGDMDIRGRGTDCSGGFLTLDAANVYLPSHLMMSGTGPQSDGGDLDVTGTGLIRLTGTVDLDGGDDGAGDITLVCDHDVEMLGTVNINGRTPNGTGAEDCEFTGRKVTIGGTVIASAGSSAVAGGAILITACDVITQPSAVLTSFGVQGSITATASHSLMIRGHLTADPTGSITLQYNQIGNPPDTTGAVFSPPVTKVLDNTIPPCPICVSNSDCADNEPCTDDVCSGNACQHPPRNGGTCDDGNLCTSNDTCVNGICTGGPPPTCADSDSCTVDGCVAGLGCLHIPITGICDDGNPCTTGDTCATGICIGTPINCSDSDPCTDDACSGGLCSHTFNTAPCNDGNLCTTADTCSNDVCVGGPATNCDDSDVCTVDSCVPATGCAHTHIPGCVDNDHDQKPDNVDECTTLVWTALPTTPPNQNPRKFGLTLAKLSQPDGSQTVIAKGQFNVAPSPQLPIDPSTNGVHVYAEDAVGPLLSVSLPGGGGCGPRDGWATLGTPTNRAWRYRNSTGALPPGCVAGSALGLESVVIKDARLTSKAALQFTVKAKDGTLLRDPAVPFTRLEVVLALSAQPSPGVASPQAKAGQCAEALFTGNPISSTTKPYCKAKLQSALIDSAKCKGK